MIYACDSCHFLFSRTAPAKQCPDCGKERNRSKALEMMDKLAQLGYIDYELNPKTKKLTYQIKDWVVQCSGEPCMGSEAIYATQGYGFLCLPRNITPAG